jgi:hypothetical protein
MSQADVDEIEDDASTVLTNFPHSSYFLISN